jgi:hypothetical protein
MGITLPQRHIWAENESDALQTTLPDLGSDEVSAVAREDLLINRCNALLELRHSLDLLNPLTSDTDELQGPIVVDTVG